MERCFQKRGFLVLRECGEPVVGKCAECGRPACYTHSKLVDGAFKCVECLAGRHDDDHDRSSFHDRTHFYGSGSTFSDSSDATTELSKGGESGGGGAERSWSDADVASFDNTNAKSGATVDVQSAVGGAVAADAAGSGSGDLEAS